MISTLLDATKRRRTENAYVLNAYKRLQRLGVPSRQEAPLLGRSIDLLFQADEGLVSVEFKLKDWRRGLRQARDHRIGADYAYLCLPMRKLPEILLDSAKQAGIGLLLFAEGDAWPFREALPALRSEITSPVARNALRAMLRTPKTY